MTLVPGEGASRGHQLSPLWLALQVLHEPFCGVLMGFRQISLKMNITGNLEGKKNSLKEGAWTSRKHAGFGVGESEVKSLPSHLLWVGPGG